MALEFKNRKGKRSYYAESTLYEYLIITTQDEKFNLVVSNQLTDNDFYDEIFDTFEDAAFAANRIDTEGFIPFYFPAPPVQIMEGDLVSTGIIIEGSCGFDILENIDSNFPEQCVLRRWGFNDERIAKFPTKQAALDFLGVLAQALKYFQTPKNT
jgi:hypothetical protein